MRWPGCWAERLGSRPVRSGRGDVWTYSCNVGLAPAEGILDSNAQEDGESMPPALRARLLPGERLIWSGRPAPAPHWALPAPGFWFGLTVVTLALWGVGLWVLRPDMVGAIAMLMPVALLFWTGVTAVAQGRRQPGPDQTLYAVTDRRALIVERRLLGSHVASYAAAAIVRVDLRPRPDLLADVVFRQGPMLHARQLLSPSPLRPTREWNLLDPSENPLGFFALSAGDAAAAAEALEALRARRLPRSSVPTIMPATPPESPP